MRQVLFAVALSLGLAVAPGCAYFQHTQETTQEVSLNATRALVTAHGVWEKASYTLQVLANTGVIKGNTALLAKKYYDQASDFLKQADHYRDIGDAVLQNQFANAAIAAIALATTQHGE